LTWGLRRRSADVPRRRRLSDRRPDAADRRGPLARAAGGCAPRRERRAATAAPVLLRNDGGNLAHAPGRLVRWPHLAGGAGWPRDRRGGQSAAQAGIDRDTLGASPSLKSEGSRFTLFRDLRRRRLSPRRGLSHGGTERRPQRHRTRAHAGSASAVVAPDLPFDEPAKVEGMGRRDPKASHRTVEADL